MLGPPSFALLAVVLLLLLGVVLFWRAGAARERSGVPAGDILYADDDAWFPHAEPLYADDLLLVGKPDYLVKRRDGTIIPVEVKSGAAPAAPYESHVLQLAAYCLLVETTHGVRPPFGILQYRDDAFEVAFTPDLEETLLDLLAEMRADAFAGDLDRDHDDPRRCAACGVRDHCGQNLT